MHITFVYYSLDKIYHSGLAALSANLKRGGNTTSFILVNQSTTAERFREELESHKPDCIAITVLSYQWEVVKRVVAAIKEVRKDLPIICGGYHTTFFPGEVMSSPHVDALCRGEGDFALLEYVDALEKGKDPSRIPNLWVRKGRRIVKNEIRNLIEDLDSLPFWDRDFLDFNEVLADSRKLNLFHDHNYIMPVAAVRGCPHLCTFCCNEGMMRLYRGKGRFVRTRSVDNLLQEMKNLASRFTVKGFDFWDEQFGMHKRWLEEFAEKYPKEVGIPFAIFIRVERMLRDDIVDLLKKAECKKVLMGIESGNEGYRRKYLRRSMTNDQIVRAFRRTREAGIVSVATNMIGLPYETAGMIRETIGLNRRIRPDRAMFLNFQAFPGTALYEIAKKEGYIPEGYAYWLESEDSYLRQPSVSDEEMKACWEECRELKLELDAEFSGKWANE